MTKSPVYPYFRTPRPLNPGAPLFIYLPGMDGTGQLLTRQLAGLEKGFDIRCLALAVNDRSSWEQLTEQVINLITTELKQHPRQSVYLCGESFGGCLALKVMLHSPQLFDRLILINPASSFKRYPWIYWGSYFVRSMPEPFHYVAYASFLPFLASLSRMEADDRCVLFEAMYSVSQETSVWRLSLLREFQVNEKELQRITQPTLVIASGSDRLLPSISEAQWLVKQLPNAQMYVLPHSGHACLLEADVNLYDIMESANFLEQPQLSLKQQESQVKTSS